MLGTDIYPVPPAFVLGLSGLAVGRVQGADRIAVASLVAVHAGPPVVAVVPRRPLPSQAQGFAVHVHDSLPLARRCPPAARTLCGAPRRSGRPAGAVGYSSLSAWVVMAWGFHVSPSTKPNAGE